jgi:hypothetical protein
MRRERRYLVRDHGVLADGPVELIGFSQPLAREGDEINVLIGHHLSLLAEHRNELINKWREGQGLRSGG